MSKLMYVLAGVAIGILIAPDKGSATRASLGTKLKKIAEGTDAAVENGSIVVAATANEVQRQLYAKSDEIERKLQENF